MPDEFRRWVSGGAFCGTKMRPCQVTVVRKQYLMIQLNIWGTKGVKPEFRVQQRNNCVCNVFPVSFGWVNQHPDGHFNKLIIFSAPASLDELVGLKASSWRSWKKNFLHVLAAALFLVFQVLNPRVKFYFSVSVCPSFFLSQYLPDNNILWSWSGARSHKANCRQKAIGGAFRTTSTHRNSVHISDNKSLVTTMASLCLSSFPLPPHHPSTPHPLNANQSKMGRFPPTLEIQHVFLPEGKN